jgi:hypothetical protein
MFQGPDEEMRKDRFGNPINESKNHKLTFADQIQKKEKLAKIYLVESYKKYNAMEVDEEETKACSCVLF